MSKVSRNKSFLDLFWSFSDNLLQQVINFVVGIILARILMPEEFGLIGIVTAFVTISNVFVDGGLSAALINKNKVLQRDYNTVFISNIVVSIFLYLVLFYFAELISVFFEKEEVKPLLQLTGLNIVLLSFSAIHRTIMIKRLTFKKITLISLVSVSISGCVAIVMAYKGFGVYSLVFRVLTGQFITVVLFWMLNKWRPNFKFSKSSFKELFGYGVNLMFSNFLNVLQSNIYYFLIGKYFSPVQLGYYTRANTFKDLASNNISNTIKRVSFSTLSKIEDGDTRFEKFVFFQSINYLLISFSMIFLFFFANEIILILLTNKWEKAIYILKILSLSGLFFSLYNLNLDFLAVLRCTKTYLKIELLGKILILPIVLVTLFFDFEMFIYSVVVHASFMYSISLYKVNKKNSKVLKIQLSMIMKFLLSIIILSLTEIGYLNILIKLLMFLSLFYILNIKLIRKVFKSF
ncbi:lipopolysaccharide biosynthesis protein [uncultured Tenacibaculum sp.]|uniref:lipopolysaccharide biosynthesis protein n=1 Tax=uncultured Tenacibaculum sp. TaxID=174713 RepID=UPI0026272296|nr:lipopolysaccharide biosynthesis protein [uncultured Tenacibaculum sp.]